MGVRNESVTKGVKVKALQTALAPEYPRVADLVESEKLGKKDAGGTVGMIPAGRVGWPCILRSSKLSTDDDAIVFEGEYCSSL
jgi:hypothetical protein